MRSCQNSYFTFNAEHTLLAKGRNFFKIREAHFIDEFVKAGVYRHLPGLLSLPPPPSPLPSPIPDGSSLDNYSQDPDLNGKPLSYHADYSSSVQPLYSVQYASSTAIDDYVLSMRRPVSLERQADDGASGLVTDAQQDVYRRVRESDDDLVLIEATIPTRDGDRCSLFTMASITEMQKKYGVRPGLLPDDWEAKNRRRAAHSENGMLEVQPDLVDLIVYRAEGSAQLCEDAKTPQARRVIKHSVSAFDFIVEMAKEYVAEEEKIRKAPQSRAVAVLPPTQ